MALEKIEKKCYFKTNEGGRKANLHQSEVKLEKGKSFGQNVSPNKELSQPKDTRA